MTLPVYPLQPRTQDALWETVAPGVTREWRFDKRMVLFHLQDSRAGVVDRYYEAVKHTMVNWPSDRLFLCVYDYSMLSASVAAYSRQRMRDLMTLSPTLEGYGAVVVSALYDCWARTLCQTCPADSRCYALFRMYDEGVDWLAQKLPLRPLGQAESTAPYWRNREEPVRQAYRRLM